MRITQAARLALATLVLGCTSPSNPDPTPGTPTGSLSGSVTLLGTEGPLPASAHLTLFASLADYEVRRAAYHVPLTPATTPRQYRFTLTGVTPGDYYVMACFEFGCGDYRNHETGDLIPIRIQNGRTTSINFSL